MAEQNNKGNEQDLNKLKMVRREKLADLQAAGKDPFVITKYDVQQHSIEVKDMYTALEAELLAGRQEPSVEGLDEAEKREVINNDYNEKRAIMDASPINVSIAALFDVTLVYCFEKKGVLRDENDDDSVIPQITRAEFEQYVADGVIQGGMIPKLENSFEAINAGVSEVIITLASAINDNGGTKIKK